MLSMVEKQCRGPHPKRSLLHCAIVPSDRLHSNSEAVAPIDVVRRQAGNTATRVSSSNRCCLGNNCRSSGLYGSVGSSQVRLGGLSGECGLVRFSCGLWNDRENDHFPDPTGATPRGNDRPRTRDRRLTDRSTLGHVAQPAVGSRGTVVSRKQAAHENASVSANGGKALCGSPFAQVAANR
jgi:hypothetical protein